jgi:GxxExxY protein
MKGWLRVCTFGGMDLYTTPLAKRVLGCAIEVHQTLGPGLLESMYQRSLAQELNLCGLAFRQQVPLQISYKGVEIGLGYRVDFLVEEELLLELKTVDRLLPVHDAQVLTYLRLLDLRQGFLLNFNTKRLMDGVRSLLNSRVGGRENGSN